MSKEWLISKLETYTPNDPKEQAFKQRTLDLVKNTERPFDRDQFNPGHVVGSGLIINKTRDKILLILHKKLQVWIQPGGHSDGNPITLEVADREVREETGLTVFKPVSTHIFDIDIHEYPARGAEPLHEHFDLRFLFEADEQTKLNLQEEEIDGIKWVALQELEQNCNPNLTRAVQKLLKIKSQKPKV